jgi:hypothetical protein
MLTTVGSIGGKQDILRLINDLNLGQKDTDYTF